ncbi:claspin-like isoform X2 [Cimex lectularius]|uniref:Claspin n=1 Tax=Cimex lectularius TaxID=79782 RepID=A0A8I6RT19_CIMLE|nr:claspin-like isoform X2 [Cimex lectularius]
MDESEKAQSDQEEIEEVSSSKKGLLSSDDSDSEDEIAQDRSKKMSVLKKKRATIDSSDSESEGNDNLKEKLSKDLFTESSDDDAKPLETSFEQNCEPKKVDKSEKRAGPGRKSKQNALEEIRSETQRMIRESKISLPYHRPKQRSLSDFLNRRKSIPGIPLRSSSKEITKVWKQIEEMEKEAESFYMSESDNEDVSNDSPDNQNKEDKDECDVTISGLTCSTESHQMAGSEESAQMKHADNNSGSTQNDNLSELDLHLTMTEEFKNSERQNEEIETNQSQSTLDGTIQDEKALKVSNKIQDESEKMFLNATLNKIPKLNGTPDEMIDLEVTKPKQGALGLLKRFIKHASIKTKKTLKNDVTLNIVSSEIDEKGEIINIKEETVKVKSGESAKPGESLVKLKATLQQKIALSREEQLAKKHEEFKLYEEEIYEGEKDVCDQLPSEDEEFEIEDSEGCSSSDEDDEDKEKEKLFADSLAEESDNEVDGDECSQVGENSQDTALVRDEESSRSSESVSSQNNYTEETIKVPTLHELMNEESVDDNLLALCSGKFFSQPVNLADLEKDDKLNCPISEDIVSSSNELIKDRNNITSDDEDDDFGISKSKKCKKLVFSGDDEDNINDDDSEKVDEESDSDNGDEEVENDGINEMDDEEVEDEETELARKISKGYLDGEAELSESDWDSADEDERGLDNFEAEEGDTDKINERKLQKELGKIHMREIMAEDKREIRLLQELLLEDGDLHSDGPKRKRLFRWANQDDDNVNIIRALDDDNELEENENHEDEEAWRKERLERENFLKQKKD